MTLITALGLATAAAAEPGDQTMNLHASAHHAAGSFKKFLYSWSLPETVMFTGLTGSIATQAERPSFNEALIEVRWVPSGACPQTGEVFDTYQQIKDRYPSSQRLAANIVKSPTHGSVRIPVAFALPGGVPIAHCIYVILDGSTIRGGGYTMTSDLVMHYATGLSALQVLTSKSVGDETCFGMPRGCGAWHTTSDTHAFMTFFRLPKTESDTELVAAHGNTSSSTMSADLLSGLATMPSTAWSVTNDLYVLADCRTAPFGRMETDGTDTQMLAGAVNILSLQSHGEGMQSVQEPIRWRAPITGIVIPKDGCLVHLVSKVGRGAINSEYQITFFVRSK